MLNLLSDFRYGCRTLLRTPGFTAAAVLALGLGIGGSSVLFSAVHAVLLRPLPYPQADRLVVVWESVHRDTVERRPASYPTSRTGVPRAAPSRDSAPWTRRASPCKAPRAPSGSTPKPSAPTTSRSWDAPPSWAAPSCPRRTAPAPPA